MRRTIVLALATCLTLIPVGFAQAKSAPVTKMHFTLSDHSLVVGDVIATSVTVTTHGTAHGNKWEPVWGAILSVRVDGVEVASVVTGADGNADVAYSVVSSGEHVMKIVYDGDDLHKKAKRAQGFNASAAPAPAPEPSPSP